MNPPKFRVGLGHDTHRLEAGRELILGGILIEFDLGLAGHSDADVLLHAIIDALLGAAGLGDIGDSFPDTEPEYEDISSAILLARALEKVRADGWEIVNLDCTIHAQQPKLTPHKSAILDNLANLLEIDAGAINVKAKTGEQVGSIGRGEAMSATAIVLLVQQG